MKKGARYNIVHPLDSAAFRRAMQNSEVLTLIETIIDATVACECPQHGASYPFYEKIKLAREQLAKLKERGEG